MRVRGWLRPMLFTALALAVPAAAKAPKVGEPAPPFEVKLLDGTRLTLAQLRGQVVVLNFWATWCVPCRQELPLLDGYFRAAQKYGLRVLAITTEDSVPNNRLKPLFGAMAITPIKGIKGPYTDMSAVPTNYVIDRQGVLRYAKAAAFSLDDLNRVLIPLLREPRPADAPAPAAQPAAALPSAATG